ncbi:hypothetical protein ACFLZY_00820 [Patescibacteria group bacterium]
MSERKFRSFYTADQIEAATGDKRVNELVAEHSNLASEIDELKPQLDQDSDEYVTDEQQREKVQMELSEKLDQLRDLDRAIRQAKKKAGGSIGSKAA